MNAWLILMGAWLIFDGVTSMIMYEKQPWMETRTEHVIRTIRMGMGAVIIYLGLTL